MKFKVFFNLEFVNFGLRDGAPSCSTHGSFALGWFFALFDGFPGYYGVYFLVIVMSVL